MEQDPIEARKQLAREVFGRELTTEQVQALGPRIDAAARNARILEAWQAELEGVEPAAVHVTPVFDAGSSSD